MNPACSVGGFYTCLGLQGTEDAGAAISVSDADMEALDGQNGGPDFPGSAHGLRAPCWTLFDAAGGMHMLLLISLPP